MIGRLKRDRVHHRVKIVQRPQGGNLAGAEVMLSRYILLRRCMLPCRGCHRLQMQQIQHGSMGGYGCSVSRCLILHIIKGKSPGCQCMTDWDHANPVQGSRLHRSDRYTLTGLTGLIRSRVKLLFQGLSIASKKRGGSRRPWLIQKSPKPMLFKSVKSKCP